MEFGPVNAPNGAVARRRRRRVALMVLLVATAGGLYRIRGSRPDDAARADGEATAAVRPSRVVPDTVRIKVEVLNATSTRGLGRLATAWLRDKGFDVVGTGTAPAAERADSTLVLDRSGHPDWAKLAAQAMGGARVEARPDSLRYVDLTVLIGRSWRPAAASALP